MKTLLGILLLVVGFGVSAPAQAALRYQGKAWSDVTGGTVHEQVVLTATGDPSWWVGRIRCYPLSPGVRCITPLTTIAVRFGATSFTAVVGDGLCIVWGTVMPGGALGGRYSCTYGGDAGTFYVHRAARRLTR